MANEILKTKIIKDAETGNDCILALTHSTWSTDYGVTKINLWPAGECEVKEEMLFVSTVKKEALEAFKAFAE